MESITRLEDHWRTPCNDICHADIQCQKIARWWVSNDNEGIYPINNHYCSNHLLGEFILKNRVPFVVLLDSGFLDCFPEGIPENFSESSAKNPLTDLIYRDKVESPKESGAIV